MAKKTKDVDVVYSGYKPGQKVDVLFCYGDAEYWVKGYTVLDLSVPVRSAKGAVKRVLKPRQVKRLADHVPVCLTPEGRCVVYHHSRVRKAVTGAVTFAEVFGTATEGGISFSGYRFDEADDVSLGLETTVEVE